VLARQDRATVDALSTALALVTARRRAAGRPGRRHASVRPRR
jgi:hypothetical protein